VRLTHRALDRTITNLIAERLIATIRELEPDAAEPDSEPQSRLKLRGQLASAIATGAVYITNGPETSPGQPAPALTELVADRVDFDAINNTVTATAAEGNRVMAFDPKQPAPASARRIFWDLKNDRLEIQEPGPIALPQDGPGRGR
jgi:hypothetical protein